MSRFFEGIRHSLNRLVENLLSQRRDRSLSAFINTVGISLMFILLVNNLSKELSALNAILLELKWTPILLALLLFGINYVFFTMSWHNLITSVSPVPMIANVLVYSESQLAKILPTPVWFISHRVVKYADLALKPATALLATGAEILLHILTSLVFLIISGLFALPTLRLPLALALLFNLYLLVSPKHLVNIVNKHAEVKVANIRASAFLLLLTWPIGYLFLHLLLQSVNVYGVINPSQTITIWTVASIISYIGSFILGGAGILREFSLTMMLAEYIPYPTALTIAALSRIVITAGNILWPGFVIGFLKLFGPKEDRR